MVYKIRAALIDTDENVAYGLSIDLNKVCNLSHLFVRIMCNNCTACDVQLPSSHDEVQYEEVDVLTAAGNTGFTMSTNISYSTIQPLTL